MFQYRFLLLIIVKMEILTLRIGFKKNIQI